MEEGDIRRLNIRTKEVVTNPNYLYIILDKAELGQGEIHTKQNLDKVKFKTRDMRQRLKGNKKKWGEQEEIPNEQGDKPLVP